ncbi:hypothetical protein ACSBPH_01565 [Microbacterium sp. F51-2R]|uniref:hypothetical protein n=1 Tax=Microbacterium sp. F51-2R TaxID=3445777 RepID=UPI003F9F0621
MGWPHDQRDLMIAYGIVERNTGRYGEWLPDVVTTWPDVPVKPARFSGPFVNWQEKVIQDAEAEHRKTSGKDANLNGMFWTAAPE